MSDSGRLPTRLDVIHQLRTIAFNANMTNTALTLDKLLTLIPDLVDPQFQPPLYLDDDLNDLSKMEKLRALNRVRMYAEELRDVVRAFYRDTSI